MAIVGWVALVLIMLPITALSVAALFFNMMKYNLGGVEIKRIDKIVSTAAFLVVCWFWYLLIESAPFSITFN